MEEPTEPVQLEGREEAREIAAEQAEEQTMMALFNTWTDSTKAQELQAVSIVRSRRRNCCLPTTIAC